MIKIPARGQVWMVDLDPVLGHEQGKRRPALVISDDIINAGPSGLVTVVPITGTIRPIPIHVPVNKGVGGLTKDSSILCDQIRTISKVRFIKPYGRIDQATMQAVEERVKMVLSLR